MIFKRLLIFSFFTASLLLQNSDLNAQAKEEDPKTGRVLQYIPAITYNSDLGLIGAGMISNFDYGNATLRPYVSYTRLLAAISTKGFATINLYHDKLGAFNSDWRIITAINAGRFFDNNYFGIGNETVFDENLWSNEGFYYYDSYNLSIDLTARYPIVQRTYTSDPLFDVYFRAVSQYQIGYAEEGSLMKLQQPEGFAGGIVNQLGLGIIYDSRDNELVPSSGSRLELELSAAPSFLGSDWSSQSVLLQYRYFKQLPLPLQPILGLQFYQLHRFGDMPFWYKATLGGDQLLRGHVINRFIGQGASLLTAELRTWVLQPEAWSIKLGAQLFHSRGRVFEEGQPNQSFFEDYQSTYGGGIALGFKQSDLILRIDYGQSEEIGRLYVTVGYAF